MNRTNINLVNDPTIAVIYTDAPDTGFFQILEGVDHIKQCVEPVDFFDVLPNGQVILGTYEVDTDVNGVYEYTTNMVMSIDMALTVLIDCKQD